MRRALKIVTMLAVFVLWICGNTYIALSCYLNRQHNHSHYHVNGSEVCNCHHEDSDKTHFESPHACNHDHSNKVALYDANKRNSIDIEPIALSIEAKLSENIDIEDVVSITSPRHYERKIPLPSSPTLSRRGLRAPPVVA